MRITDLPHFTITSVETSPTGLRLRGSFDSVDTVIEEWCCLYSPAETLVGDLHDLDRQAKTALFDVFNDDPPGVIPGAVFPWIHGYWRGRLVSAIVDPEHRWKRTAFEPSDAEAFVQGHANGRLKVGNALPSGSESRGIIPNGWDHEHCEICEATISAENPDCYTDDSGNWLCAECYAMWAEPQDVGFLFAR